MKGGIQKVFSKLNENLYCPFVFYIPESILPKNKIKELDTPEFKTLLNTLILINEKGNVLVKDVASHFYMILGKVAVLDNNVFLLLEAKENYSEVQFGYLKEKYLTNLNFYVFVCDWMVKNIIAYSKYFPKEAKTYLEFQHTAMEKHLATYQKYFQHQPLALPKIKNFWNNIEEVFPPYRELATPSKSNLVKATNNKQQLINDQEAIDFLLTTVFNVKI